MRSLRILLALLIALALPVQSLAEARMACWPTSAMDAPHAEMAGHDCYSTHETNASDKHCDEDSGCHCSLHFALAIHDVSRAASELEHYPAVFISLPRSAPSAAHWRPPAPRTELI